MRDYVASNRFELGITRSAQSCLAEKRDNLGIAATSNGHLGAINPGC